MKKMRKITGILSILLIFLMCINSVAAVVSDNDGAAFITKAEFDSLKNNFQNLIDNYNKSIDNKIDGAIASYLAGINLQNKISSTFLFDVNEHSSVRIESKTKDCFKRTTTYCNEVVLYTNVMRTDSNFGITLINKKFEDMTGYIAEASAVVKQNGNG